MGTTKKAARAAFSVKLHSKHLPREEQNENRSGRFPQRAKFLVELLDAPRRIHNFLFAGVERMAGRTDFHMQGFLHGRTGGEAVAARTRNRDLFVIGMDTVFHVWFLEKSNRRMWPVWETRDYL
jgi:hypothetical protein